MSVSADHPFKTCFPAALYLPGDAFDASRFQLIGRRIAGLQFAQAMAASLRPAELLRVVCPEPDSRNPLVASLRPVVPAKAGIALSGEVSMGSLAGVDAIHYPDPSIAAAAEWRAANPGADLSITGIIHTLCTTAVVAMVRRCVAAPVAPWDALVCTSRAGRSVVESILAQHTEYLARRFSQASLSKAQWPSLPVIPLPAPVEPPIAPGLSRQERRAYARQRLGIAATSFVACSVGRLSFHSKAHPLALYRALAGVVEAHPDLLLLECGQYSSPQIAGAYRELQERFPQLRFQVIGGLEPATDEEKWLVYAAADVFVSPADSIQETFGLTLLEAMLAELPLVVSDWDGYRDLVQEGVTGFLVPTADVLVTTEQVDSIQASYLAGTLSYNRMVALRSLGVVVDVDALGQALATLADDPALARRMGQQGAQRLREHYAPPVIAGRYRQLWGELGERRRSASEEEWRGLRAWIPADARLFQGYGSQPFTAESVRASQQEPGDSLLSDNMNAGLFDQLCLGQASTVRAHLRDSGELSLAVLLSLGYPEERGRQILATLVKLGVADVSWPS
ncbi:glycosyltransferase family 4 protein [Vulcanococcus limneticus]|uniref:glycosyltransferase family 4 protein n=1 Tax=Vulcanococcus limneticus TaxID=2170428 RepID=UPI00398BFA95